MHVATFKAGTNVKVETKYATYIRIINESITLSVSKPIVYPELIIANVIRTTAYKPHNNTGPR